MKHLPWILLAFFVGIGIADAVNDGAGVDTFVASKYTVPSTVTVLPLPDVRFPRVSPTPARPVLEALGNPAGIAIWA